MKKVASVIMHASLEESPGEHLVEGGRKASTCDLIETLYQAGIEQVVLVTNNASFASSLSERGVLPVLSSDKAPFHFGQALQRVIAEHSLDGLLYFGSGSGGLLNQDQVATLAWFSQREQYGALFNNFYSCDFCAIAGAKRLLKTDLPEIDNPLGFFLSDVGVPCFTLPREVSTQFDIDTPTDLLLLAGTVYGGDVMRVFLGGERLTHPSIAALLKILVDRSAHLTVIGRLNPATWAHFEQEVACRTSGLSEGRGMRAYPNQRGILLNAALREMGIDSFFKRLVRTTDAAIIDTRPLVVGERPLPPPADRFASDLLRPEMIGDPLWAEFTRAAMEAKIPILLGGHSLVSGGLYLLAEACWKDRNLPRRLHVETIDWKKERP